MSLVFVFLRRGGQGTLRVQLQLKPPVCHVPPCAYTMSLAEDEPIQFAPVVTMTGPLARSFKASSAK